MVYNGLLCAYVVFLLFVRFVFSKVSHFFPLKVSQYNMKSTSIKYVTVWWLKALFLVHYY